MYSLSGSCQNINVYALTRLYFYLKKQILGIDFIYVNIIIID